jgi:hypothetical protein
MVEEKTFLLEQAARCRRLAQTVNDVEFAERMMVMAQEYEEKAFTSQARHWPHQKERK